ncbi:transcriptional repressor LexA [bacterium]|nr:transcriptional repressor LexA [bacterium]
MSLTPKQKKILEYIESFVAEKGYGPSQQEIAQHFRFKSLGTVQNYLIRLKQQGVLRQSWNARRSLEIVQSSPLHPKNLQRVNASPGVNSGTVPLPLLGRVAAGRPIEAITSNEMLDVPVTFLKRSGDHFVLKVKGDSMIGDGILNGDYVIIHKQPDATNGQTVVALVGNEATIKRYYRKGGSIELHAANPAYDPILVSPEVESTKGFKIEGILIGLIRRTEY